MSFHSTSHHPPDQEEESSSSTWTNSPPRSTTTLHHRLHGSGRNNTSPTTLSPIATTKTTTTIPQQRRSRSKSPPLLRIRMRSLSPFGGGQRSRRRGSLGKEEDQQQQQAQQQQKHENVTNKETTKQQHNDDNDNRNTNNDYHHHINQQHYSDHVQAKSKQRRGGNVLLCHSSAHAIVFRDHLRLARKIIHEVEEEDEDEEEDDLSSSSSSDDDDSDLGEGAFQNLRHTEKQEKGEADKPSSSSSLSAHALHESLRESLRQSLRESFRQQTLEGTISEAIDKNKINNDKDNNKNNNNKNDIPMVQQVNALAHTMVPELSQVQLSWENMSERSLEIEGLHAHMTPLEDLEWSSPRTEYVPLLLGSDNNNNKTMTTTVRGSSSSSVTSATPNSTAAVPIIGQDDSDWSPAERHVYRLLQQQRAVVKTIRNSEWPQFMQRFQQEQSSSKGKFPAVHDDIPPNKNNQPFNAFYTSTSLLPYLGRKMRAYGSETSYTVGVVFALPEYSSSIRQPQSPQQPPQSQQPLPPSEAADVAATQTWAWPAGYAAKTEFNIAHGELINGRKEALVSLEQLRLYNDEYLHKPDHYIAGRIIKGGFKVVPYNEVYVRVGGPGRIVNQKDVVTGQQCIDSEGTGRSFATGLGLFIALFIRTITCADILTLFRTRARIAHLLGPAHEKYVDDIPLLYMHPNHGVRVFTKSLQMQFWKDAARKLQPFGNPSLAPTLKYDETNEMSLKQKLEELLVLTDEMMDSLTPEECAGLAGGFGVTDESFLHLLRRQPDGQALQQVMHAAWAASIRANDYYSARQALILFALESGTRDRGGTETINLDGPACTFSNHAILNHQVRTLILLPLPLSTKRLRRAVR